MLYKLIMKIALALAYFAEWLSRVATHIECQTTDPPTRKIRGFIDRWGTPFYEVSGYEAWKDSRAGFYVLQSLDNGTIEFQDRERLLDAIALLYFLMEKG